MVPNNKLFIVIVVAILQTVPSVSAELPDPAPGEVFFGADTYQVGDTMTIITEGQFFVNDEVWLLYDPSGNVVKRYDPDANLLIGNEVFYYTADRSGKWSAQFLVKAFTWPWEPERWYVIYQSDTNVIPRKITGLRQTGSTRSSISLAWNSPGDDGFHHYEVEVKEAGQTSVNSYTFYYSYATIDDMKSGTSYDVRVRAEDISFNHGAWSDFVTMPTVNDPPVASIDYIYPDASTEGQSVSFKGTGTDPDGTIRSYKWRSSLNGELGSSSTFSTSSLSIGKHTIYFSVMDNAGAWSQEVNKQISVSEIRPNALVSISSNPSYPTVNDGYTITVTAENTGGSADGHMTLYENGVPLKSEQLRLSKGEKISFPYPFSKISPGRYDYRAEVSLSNGAGSNINYKTANVLVYSGAETIRLSKKEYYVDESPGAVASGIISGLNYKAKWYKNGVLVSDVMLVNNYSRVSTTVRVGDAYKVDLTKPDGTLLSSDSATVVVTPLTLTFAVILAKPNDMEPNPDHGKQYFRDILNRTRDYYLENSYGRIVIDVDRSVIYDDNGKWFRLYKNNVDYGRNGSDGRDNSFEFAAEAFDIAGKPGMYDILVVVHPGDCEQISIPNNPDLMKTEASLNNIILSENDLMGTWAHEVGHVIGRFEKVGDSVPDRYKNGNLRNWDLMSHGNYVTDDNSVSYPTHMSSWTKEYLDWLTYNITSSTGTYWIPALEQQKYGDYVTVYNVPQQPGMNKYSYILEVRSENVGVWDRYVYGDKIDKNDTLVIYKVNTSYIGSKSDIVNVLEDGSDNDMVLLSSKEFYTDSRAEVVIKLEDYIGNTSKGYGGNARIIESRIFKQNAMDILTVGNLSGISAILSVMELNLTLPDYDLHAFAADGRHVGMNYTTGVYENQIAGATASGDMLWGDEWIFVPEYEKIKFMVSNHDTEEFLKKHPEAANITVDMKYNFNIYHEDSMSNRYYAGMTDQKIAPGKERNYMFDVIENPDGTFTIILDHEPPVISNVNPVNNVIVGRGFNISANYQDEGTGIDVNSIILKVDGIDITSNATVAESSLLYMPELEDGEHSFEITVSDNMENTATVNYSFTLDTTPPYVEITYPGNSSFVHQTVQIQGIATDLHPGAVSFEIDGIKVSDTSGFVWDTTTYADGNHDIKLTATDVAGNTNSTSIEVIVDNTPPEITFNIINGTEIYSDEKWTADFTATDSLSGVDSTTISMDGNLLQKGDIVDMRYLSLGEHSVIAAAYDRAGNYNSTSRIFKIKPLPAIVELSPKTLNINSSGNWITGLIEVPNYSADMINAAMVRLNETIHAEIHPTSAGDYNNNGVSDLVVKFNRSEVQRIVTKGDITLYITGKVNDAAFSGNTSIRVIGSAASDKTNGNTKGNVRQ